MATEQAVPNRMAGGRRQTGASRAAEPAGAARSAGAHRAGLFLRSIAFDFVLVLVVTTALSFTVSYGFNSAPDLRSNVAIIAVVSAVLLACLYIGQWSRRALAVSAVAYVVAAVAVVAAVSALSPEQVPLFADGQVNDVESNYAVFGMVLVVVPIIVFLLSRRTWGMVLLMLVGALACCAIQFLYRDWVTDQPGTEAALVAFIGIGALFVVQGYRQGVLQSRAAKKTSFAAAFAFGVVGSALCVGVGVLAFLGVISGLGIQTIDVKPFEDYYSRPIIEYNGTYAQQQVIDPNLGTSVLSDEEGDTIEDAAGEMTEDDPNDSGGGFWLVSAVTDLLDVDDWNSMFDAVRFDVPFPMKVFLALLPILLVVAAVLLRRSMRARRLKALEGRSASERVAALYDFFMQRFKRLGINKAVALTPLEFALASADETAAFNRNPLQTDFFNVTLAYQRAAYGAGASEEDYEMVESYYNSFFENARGRMSALKWAVWGFWRI